AAWISLQIHGFSSDYRAAWREKRQELTIERAGKFRDNGVISPGQALVPEPCDLRAAVARNSGAVRLGGTGDLHIAALKSKALERQERDCMKDEALSPGIREPSRERGPPWRDYRPSYDYPRAGGPKWKMRPTYAALDLGTNNCRLLVARPAGDGFRVIDAF